VDEGTRASSGAQPPDRDPKGDGTPWSALRSGVAGLIRTGGLRLAFASNFTSHALAVLASLATFRLMIVLTDMPTTGLWAMILGFAVTAGVAEMGLGLNLIRFVAAHESPSRRLLLRLSAVGAIMCMIPAALLGLLAAWPIYWFAVTRPDLPVSASAVAVLTVSALAVTFVNTAISIFSGLAEGLGRVALRSAAMLLYNVVTLALIWPALWLFGPVGIGLANLAGVSTQLGLVVAVLLVTARKLPRTADDATVSSLLRTLLGSTMQNFGIVLARLTFDPVARFYVALGGSLTVQAWFELAVRVSNQVRQVVQVSLQPLVFIGASDHASMAERFERPHSITVRLSATMLLSLACISPLISAVVLGQIVPGFIIYLLIMGVGGAVYMIGVSGQNALAALGRFDVLLKLWVFAAALNVALGGLALLAGGGPFAGAGGLAAAFAITGILLARQHARIAARSLRSRFDGLWPLLVMGTATGAGLALAAARLPVTTVVALSAASCLLLIVPGWRLGRMFLRRDI